MLQRMEEQLWRRRRPQGMGRTSLWGDQRAPPLPPHLNRRHQAEDIAGAAATHTQHALCVGHRVPEGAPKEPHARRMNYLNIRSNGRKSPLDLKR